MPELKLRQLQHETDTWRRLVGFMMEENINLKNRLSDILKDQFDPTLLEQVETFQSRVIKGDELIVFLRNNLAELDDLLEREVVEDGALSKKIEQEIKSLRRNIKTAEELFSKLQIDFNSYFAENI